ncbi:MAG: thiol peroxidase [Bacteroidaceae bacterium]|nr:thiol peroxidase [Bacteroidaceae bacterium]
MMKTTFLGNPVSLLGEMPAVGDLAPDFEMVKGDLSTARLTDFRGKRVVLNVFPSMDTDVCAASVRRFNKEAAALDNTVVLCISKDLPFAQARFCTANGIENVVPLSAFRCEEFDAMWGLRITSLPMDGLLARAVVIVDEEGVVRYAELVPEITQEPDYAAAIAALA